MSAIVFDHVCKNYRGEREHGYLSREVLSRVFGKRPSRGAVEALVDVSFRVERGEKVAVIGSNGSGKSTTLSLAAGTSYPSSGRVEVNGRIGPLLELGAGFHPALTGRENIILNGSLLGMKKEEVLSQLDSILDYSGVGEFGDAAVSTFSSGMIARLGFAVLAHMKPDVLLVDEALSVGDAEFRAKCEATIDDLFAGGATILLVSHSLGTVLRICERTIWIEKGRLRMDGPSAEVVAAYREFSLRPARR
jgi:ABC-type polysaccharide/polyol phosphate transport system ATPase subunit